MDNSKSFSVRKGYLAALALAVVFSAVQFGGSDFNSKSLQTAVVPTGYTDSYWIKTSYPSQMYGLPTVSIDHSDSGDKLKVYYWMPDVNADNIKDYKDCEGFILSVNGTALTTKYTGKDAAANGNNLIWISPDGTGTCSNTDFTLHNSDGTPLKLALSSKQVTYSGIQGTPGLIQYATSSSPTTQWNITGSIGEVQLVSSYGSCDAGKYWNGTTSTCVIQPTCGNGTWDSATNACSYGSCTTDTWGLNKPECSATATSYSDCRDPYYWYNKTSGVFEKCSKDAAVKADFCNNTTQHTPCETVKTDRITLLEKAFVIDSAVKTEWLAQSWPSPWWEPVWDSTAPYKKYDSATDSLVACTSNSTTWVSGQYNGSCQPVPDKWKEWYLLKWRGEYAEWKKWNTTTTCNNNKVCDSGETITSCPSDCVTSTVACDFDKVCEYGESTGSCPSDCTTVTPPPPAMCNNNKTCDAGETMSTCPSDCTTWTPPADWKEIIWNNLGLKSYVSINIPQTVVDEAKKACANTKPENVTWPNPSDFTKPATAGVPSCTGTTPPPGGGDTVTGTAKSCATGERCPKDSWCSNGKQCYYPDGNVTCAAWTMYGDTNCATVVPGTKECSPTDTNCIEPGGTGSVNGWCKSGMECFTTDGAKKFCQPWSYSGYGGGSSTSCPTGYKICSPDDKTCIEPGATGPLGGWCKNSMECFTADGSQKFCQSYSNEPGKSTTCPAGSKLCGSNDPNCIEPGSAGAVNGWCKNSQECFSKDGLKKYCNPWPENMMTMGGGNIACPAEYPNECRPDDTYCTELGETNPMSGAYCFPGGKQCYKADGLYCVEEGTSCPKDSKKCPTNVTPMPSAYSPFGGGFTSQCIEDEGPIDGWCGGTSTVQCYNNNGKTKKCIEVDSYNDPQAWENTACPTGYNRCAPNSVGCLGYIGAKGKKGDWCAIGMTKNDTDGTVTCVSSKDWMPVPGPMPKPLPLPICTTGDHDVTAYDPATNDCKIFANSCNVAENWTIVTDGRICKDGKLVNLESIVKDDASLKMILNEKRKYLDDLEMRISTLPAFASGKEAVLSSILDAQVYIKTLYQVFPTKNKADREVLLSKINNLVKDTIPTIEKQMEELDVYINFNILKVEIYRDLERYRMILDRADVVNNSQKKLFYKKLDEGVSRLESLLKNAETATGDVLEQLISVIETQWHDLQSLVDGQSDDLGNEFLTNTIADLNESLERFEDIIGGGDIDMPFIFNHMDKFRKLMSIINEIDVEDAGDSDRQRVNEAVKLKDKLALWLGERPKQDLISIDNILDMMDQRITDALDKALNKLENKFQLMMDESLKAITMKLTEVAEKTIEKFSSKFTDLVTQNTNNLTAVPEEQREILADDTVKILDKTESLVENLDTSDLSSFAKESFLATMEKTATNVWCGDYAQKIQSELNSKGLALEAGRVDAKQVADFDKEVNEWITANQTECYEMKVTPGMDVPMESWYHPYTMFNFTRGYMHGYGGDQAGNFGPGNSTLRIEALAMIMRLLEIPLGDYSEPVGYIGVPTWPNKDGLNEANTYVNGATAFLDKSWNMSQPITRGETAKLFVAAMTSLPEPYITMPTVVEDANKYTDYAKFSGDKNTALAVEALTDAGIFKGAGDGGFHPYDSLLRSEFAAINQRVVENLDVGGELDLK